MILCNFGEWTGTFGEEAPTGSGPPHYWCYSMGDIFAIVLVLGGGTLFLLAISPIGRAVASRIERRGEVDEDALEEIRNAQHEIAEELAAVRVEIVDMNERIDFTERLLSKSRETRQIDGSDVQN